MSENGESDGWDEQWTRVIEMPAGHQEELPYAKQIVNAEMERLGNRVGRPLVMKVTVEVYDGEVDRPDGTDTEHTDN